MRHPMEYRRRLTRAMHHMIRHLDREQTLAEIAATACFSPYHFHRLFAALTGETVAEFRRRLRLEMAVYQLIHQPERPIADIAQGLGFSSAQNFARACRHGTGQTPSQLRHPSHRLTLAAAGPMGPLAAPALSPHPIPLESKTMDVKIIERPSQRLATIRVVGPYPQTLPGGFARLERWSQARGLGDGDWLALYWDNPQQTPEAQLRADVALSVPEETQLDGEVQWQTLPAGSYACYRCRVENDDFATPWNALFGQWLPASGYQPAAGPCCEQYLNDGRTSGVWELLLFTPVKPL